MSALLRMEVVVPARPASDVAAQLTRAGTARAFWNWLTAFFAGLVTGAMVRLGIDESSPVAATGTVVFTQANLTAGDAVCIDGVTYTGVAGVADATLGQFSIETSNTAVGASFVLALAAFPRDNGGPRPLAVGVNTAGSVALTWGTPGIGGNLVVMQEKDASGGIALTQFSGGREPGSLRTVVGTFTNAPADGGTLTIGTVVLTTAASPANESEWDNGTNGPTAAANLIACINAHSKLKGIVVASAGSTTSKVNMQFQISGRIGALILVTEALSNYTQDRADFAPAGTEAWSASPVVAAIGPATSSPQA